MATTRIRSYKLNCRGGEYENLIGALSILAMHKENQNGKSSFIMPGGKVKIFLRDEREYKNQENEITGKINMDVMRTTWKEPRFIKRLVNRLEGVCFDEKNFSEEERIMFYLEKNYQEFSKNKYFGKGL